MWDLTAEIIRAAVLIVLVVVVADVGDDAARFSLDRVQFVIEVEIVAWASWDLGQPTPRLAVVR